MDLIYAGTWEWVQLYSADFHSLGSLPKERDMLKSLVTAGDILVAVCFCILADTGSRPVALAGSREDKR